MFVTIQHIRVRRRYRAYLPENAVNTSMPPTVPPDTPNSSDLISEHLTSALSKSTWLKIKYL